MPDKGLILRRLLGVLLACVLLLGATGCGKPSGPEAGPADATEAPHSPASLDEPAVTEAPEKPAAPPEPAVTEAPKAPASTDEPTATEAPDAAAEPDPAKTPDAPGGTDADGQTVTYAAGYVRVTSPTRSGWLPLPAEEDYVVPLRQLREDGTEAVNTIHLTPAGVYMESATCENQDCVHQGEVTLDNISSRILGNMIICLPNQVVLELYSAEELLAADGE